MILSPMLIKFIKSEGRVSAGCFPRKPDCACLVLVSLLEHAVDFGTYLLVV